VGPPFFDCSKLEPEHPLHADTSKLIALWQAEAARDQLLQDIAALHEALDASNKVLVIAENDIEHIQQECDAKKTEEHAHSRRLHTYTKKRDETRNLIDTGRTSDYLIAERQFSSCAAIADEEETFLLEIMEQLDTIDGRLQSAISVCELKEHQRNERVRGRDDQLPGLQERLTEATELRDSARDSAPVHLMGRYNILRKKGISCVASVVSGSCGGCRVKITSVHLAEHKRGAKTHHCQNCGRFIGALD
jgi:predicted  nucleic acid-binding Zn-ribbon protein